MAQRTNRTEKLDLRLTPAAKHALRLAAASARESVSHLVHALETAGIEFTNGERPGVRLGGPS